MKRQTATVDCPKSMVGRVIGKSGETIKALQSYTGALIQIDQTVEPTKVTISGTPHSLNLAVSMVTDIVRGTFKGFALLRQVTTPGGGRGPPEPVGQQPRPVYAPGYGLIPPSQLYGADERAQGMVPRPTVGWAPGQVTPQPVVMGMQPGTVLHPMGQAAGGMMAPGMAQMTGEEQLVGYAPAGMAPMAYAYPQEYAVGGVMQQEVVYGEAPAGGMLMQAAPVGAGARLYGAAGGGAGGPSASHAAGGIGKASAGWVALAGDAGGAGVAGLGGHKPPAAGGPAAGVTSAGMVGSNLVQVMDPSGQVYYVDRGAP